MRNVHERVIDAPAASVGVLLDGLGSEQDRLWPAPVWPPMRLDRPLAVGADGGHDEIRYSVSRYEPGRRVEFRFDPAIGLDGFHALEVEPVDAGSCVLRHVLVGRPRGRMRLLVPLVVRWLHDAVVEDLLDNAERAATGTVAKPYRHSLWVRLLRWLSAPWARSVLMPSGPTLLAASLERIDYADAYSVVVPEGVSKDPRTWADELFTGSSAMPRLSHNSNEVLLGADHRHLSYRVGVLVGESSDRATTTVATVVQFRSRAGRAYFAIIRRCHSMVVRLLLRRATLRLVGRTSAANPSARRLIVVE